MKNKLIYTVAVLLAACCSTACNKKNDAPPVSSSLNIVNGISGSGALVPNFNSNSTLVYFKTAKQIPANGFIEFGGYYNDQTIAFSQLSDTTQVIFTHTVHVRPGSINTLFLAGTLAAPDFLYTTDKVVAIKDSAINIRFVNLSQGSSPVSIDLQNDLGNKGRTVETSLAYKVITDFKPFTAKTATPASGAYTFEFRDKASGNVLATCTVMPLVPDLDFKSITIALVGIPDDGSGNGTQQAIQVNSF